MDMHKLATALALTALVATGGSAHCAELKVLITTAMKAAIDDLGPAFESRAGTRCASLRSVGRAGEAVADGEGVDLVIIAGGVEELIKQGKVAPDSRVDVARVRIGVAVRKGALKPDIGTVDAFRRTLIAAKITPMDPAPAEPAASISPACWSASACWRRSTPRQSCARRHETW